MPFPEAARMWPSGPFSTVSRLSASTFHGRLLVLEVLTLGRLGDVTGNGERGTGNGKREKVGVYSGNLPDNLNQNGGRRKERGNK